MNKNRINMALVLIAIFLLFFCKEKKLAEHSTVLVSGIGIVLVQPDMVQMNILTSYTAQTMQQAKREVDIKMQQIMNILKADKIEDKDIKTVSLGYDREIEYMNGRSVLIGQRAHQAIVVTINDIINNPNRLPELLDKLTAIDRVVISNIIFDTKDKTELFSQSRELAYQKALDKANQYAELTGHKIVKTLRVSEERNRDILRAPAYSNVAYDTAGYSTAASAVPTGEQEVTTEIIVTFLME
jgi:uncharacterized protein YggE